MYIYTYNTYIHITCIYIYIYMYSMIGVANFDSVPGAISQGPATLLNELRDCGLNLMPKEPMDFCC